MSCLDPSVTVAVCTYRRPALLRETLRTLVRQDYPSHLLDLLVVDNNSPEDTTRQVVASFAGAPIAPRYLREVRQGLSHARNRALAASDRDVIVFVDDDVILEPDWLRQLLAPLAADATGRISAVGGEVVPVYPEGLSPWALTIYEPLRLRRTPGPLPHGEIPMGANLAFRRRALLDVGAFDPEVGRNGAGLLAGDENRPVERLQARGNEIWFVPAARAFHQMPLDRTTPNHVLSQAYGSARSRVLNRLETCRRDGRSPWPYLGSRFAANVLKSLLFGTQGAALLVLLQPRAACLPLVRAWRACGYLHQISLTFAKSLGLGRPRPRRPLRSRGWWHPRVSIARRVGS